MVLDIALLVLAVGGEEEFRNLGGPVEVGDDTIGGKIGVTETGNHLEDVVRVAE